MPTKLWSLLNGGPAPQYTPNWFMCPNAFSFSSQNNNYIIPAPIYSDYFQQNQSYFVIPSMPEQQQLIALLSGNENIQIMNTGNMMEKTEIKNGIKVEEIQVTQSRRKKKNELQNIKDWEKDRNILSNSLKLFLKQLRLSLKQAGNHQEKIIRQLCLSYRVQDFDSRLNQLLPPELNYIRPNIMKNIIESQSKDFSLILQISFRKFFKETIYLTLAKSTQIKRSIKRQQIKAGRKLLQYFFGQQEQRINEKW